MGGCKLEATAGKKILIIDEEQAEQTRNAARGKGSSRKLSSA